MNMEELCEKDCETKELFENGVMISEAVMHCLSCIHSKRVNNYIPRKYANEMTILQRIKRNVKNYFMRNSRF